MSRRDRDRESDPKGLDEPPNSRLFILCQKGTSESDFEDAFKNYGRIEDIWIIKDKRTNEDRGIAYIKFSKTSEAMQAMEEMNGKTLSGTIKGLKIVVANSKRDGSTRDPREDERLVRLFLVIPKHFSESDLKEEFSKYGDVESVTILKNRSTGESKGFGYVRYFKPLHAAIAFENCESSYKPKFAEPQRSRDGRDEYDHHNHNNFPSSHGYPGAGLKRNYNGDYGGGYKMDGQGQFSLLGAPAPNFPQYMKPSNGPGPMDVLAKYPATSQCSRLMVQAPLGLTQNYLSKLFNLIPGMDYCDLNESSGIAYVRYSSQQCAAFAKDRLNGFEYPLGSPLLVQFAEDNSSRTEFPMNIDSYGGHQYRGFGQGSMSDNMDITQKAMMILEKAGINPQTILRNSGHSGQAQVGDGRQERPSYCSILLPPPQPPVQEDKSMAVERLFVVCQPNGVSERVLRDAFCRFGDFIDVYLLTGRNYGYAKFASKASAMKAMEALHGQSLMGQRLKVLEAEPPKSGASGMGDEGPPKKQRL